MKRAITEEEGVHQEWYREAEKMTVERLPDFVKGLVEDYDHDYGTIVHAITSAALAAAHAVDHDPKEGGITGCQAGFIQWEFLRHWNHWKEGDRHRLQNLKHLLFPQYEDNFRRIDAETHEWLKNLATQKLRERKMAPRVREHMEKVAGGWLPFGFEVERNGEEK